MVTTLYKPGTRKTRNRQQEWNLEWRRSPQLFRLAPAILHLATSQPGGDVSYTQPPDHYADYQWNQEQPGSNSGLYFLVSFYPTVESLTAPLAECVGTVTCTFEQQRTSMILMTIKCTITNLLHPSVILCWLTSTPHLLPGTGGYMHTINSKIYRKWPNLEWELTMITYL